LKEQNRKIDKLVSDTDMYYNITLGFAHFSHFVAGQHAFYGFQAIQGRNSPANSFGVIRAASLLAGKGPWPLTKMTSLWRKHKVKTSSVNLILIYDVFYSYISTWHICSAI